MCTFVSTFPRKTRNSEKKNNLSLFLKPCPTTDDGKKTWYRFRLLAWTSPELNDRQDIHIERFVHQIWKKNEEKGYMYVDDEVTCPVTKHVHFEGNRYNGCPICNLADQYFGAWKESGWKNREAAKKNKTIGRKYQAIVPVYVVEDPNYPKNKGQVKVIIFNSKAPSKKELESGNYNKFSYYSEFKKLVEAMSQNVCVFNGKQAVDCCIHVSEIQKKVYEGLPNEYIFREKVIDKIVFSKDPYDIPEINKDLVINCGFDDEYYTSSTSKELQDFYNRNFKISNDDIPDEDDVQIYDTKQTTSKKEINVENTKQLVEEKSINDINTLPFDVDEQQINLPTEQENLKKINKDISTEDLFKELGIQ